MLGLQRLALRAKELRMIDHEPKREENSKNRECWMKRGNKGWMLGFLGKFTA